MVAREATPAPDGFVARVIAACARNPGLTVLAVAAAFAWGVLSILRTPLDAIPDLSDVQVIVYTEWPGKSPTLVEDQVTYPISATLLSTPRVRYVRGQSFFGLSFVDVIFEDGTDLYWARSRVLETMNTVQGRLPDGVAPTLGPDATGVGWVFEYALVDRSGHHDLAQLRSLQDWNLRYALASVPGVAEVASVGGFVKQYQVAVDPNLLRSYGVPLGDVLEAVRASNQETGGGVLETAEHEQVVRGRGYVTSTDDLRSVPLRVGASGVPVTLRDVAEVTLGPALRRGIAELDGRGEVVGGIVIMRSGENALAVIDAVKRRLGEVRPGLPEGVEVVVTYDRSELIRAAVATLRHTLVEELAVVSVVILLFLLHVRSALVPILTIPVGIALAFVPMLHQGLTADIMSLGGLAVAIGAMVDAAIIVVENVHKRLEGWSPESRESRNDVILRAMQEVGPSIFFALLVITVSFLPIFSLTGTEGRLFRPLAFTKTYAMGFAAVLSVTLTPAIAATLIRGRIRSEHENPVNRWLVRAYAPVVRAVVRHRRAVVAAAVLALASAAPPFLLLGSEFMPPFNEGTLLYMPTGSPGLSITEAGRILQTMDRELRSFPEVARVFGKIGRSESPTDPAPLSMVETNVVLKPRSEWRRGVTWDSLVQEMDEKLRYPGMPNLWWMPIQTRTEMLATGVRSPLGIKVFGDDLEAVESAAASIAHALAAVPGTRNAFLERTSGAYYLDARIDRAAAARFGVSAEAINQVVEAAVGGAVVSQIVEGRERYSIEVRYAREWRDDPARIGDVLVAAASGAQVPLSQVATFEWVNGPDMVRSEAGRVVGLVAVDVAGRPIVDYVADARRAIEAEVRLPPGTRVAFAGQFESFERAKRRLAWVVPLTLGLVVLLLYLNTGSAAETAIVALAVPFSLVGAVWLLWLLGYHLSVAVWVGVIALAGLDAQTGVVMLLYLTLAHRAHAQAGRLRSFADLEESIVEGAARRIRPKLMTVLTMVVGLAPLLWSTGTGADVMKRIAAPMVGGLGSSFLMELLVYPALFAIWKERSLARGSDTVA